MITAIALFAAGIIVFLIGLRTEPEVTWGSFLLANYYFLSLSIGAAFFLAIQSITQSGWASAFKRVPEAMTAFIPVAGTLFLLIFFGIHSIYKWSVPENVSEDALLQYKSPYLNMPFFFLRMIVFFLLWTFLTTMLRKYSVEEDRFSPGDSQGILALFRKSETYSKIFIFILAITFSVGTFDWILSIETHWYSTVFAFKNFIAAFLHGVTVIALIVFILKKKGCFPFLNKYHLHDFARYIFILSIIWGYLWFAQFIIIWYGNIPEETAFYYYRFHNGWKVMFYLQIALNWGVPFLVLLPVKTSRNMTVITGVIIVLIIGQYIDLFVEIFPALTGALSFGWIEAGVFLGFAGIFALTVARALNKAELIPRNHPYLEESINHQFE
jgi:hypothetical protein